MTYYVFKVESDVINGTQLVVAADPDEACRKYCSYWFDEQNRLIDKNSITSVIREGEVIL